MATTNNASTKDSTMLFLFCGSNYYVIDDYHARDVYAGPIRITETWPELKRHTAAPAGDGAARGTFASDLDAVYYETTSKRLVFFKGASCVVADYSLGQEPTWESGLITDYYQVAGSSATVSFADGIDGAVVGRSSNPNVAGDLFLIKKGQYAAGPSKPPQKGHPMPLTYSSTKTQAGWPVPTDDDTTVAAEYVYPPGSQVWESTLFLTHHEGSQSPGDYQVMFYTSTQKDARPNELWPSFNGAPIDAAVRLDPSMCRHGSGDPHSGGPDSGDPHSGGPDSNNPHSGKPHDGTGHSLCCQLPAILQTICNMTALLNKVVDACYPPSSWPKHPYPSGCGNDGHKGCGGCSGKHADGDRSRGDRSGGGLEGGSGH
ncbi:hypothetical protein [Bordetella flabilis]|uniref:Uncharacterized protein n=1 Tax=Bordetella flabilis TaxID=463014 RepID=A0A193GGA6_9BORD|nr:hypothetical protein [Bordetella flabilis]ANN78633.1 hypothetical protein BAU07_17285 [Bordetella flabilis]